MFTYLNIIEVTKRVIPDRQIEVIHITMKGLSAFEITFLKRYSILEQPSPLTYIPL